MAPRPPRAEARKTTPQDEARRRDAEIIAIAMKDPELRRLQADYDFRVQTMTLQTMPDSTELLRYYALHHPDAGLAWLTDEPGGQQELGSLHRHPLCRGS